MTVLKAYKKQVTINGMSKNAVVTIEVEQDEIDFSYWDKKDAKRTQADMAKGLVDSLWVLVRVSFSDLEGYEGLDSLGQVIVRGTPEGALADVLATIKDHDMVLNAESDLIQRVLEGQTKLTKFLLGDTYSKAIELTNQLRTINKGGSHV